MRRLIGSIAIFLFVFLICMNGNVSAQDDSSSIAMADTTGFTVNGEDWQLFNSYVSAIHADSVKIEFIVRQTGNLDLKQEQYIGKVKKSNLFPLKEQLVIYNLISTKYQLRITTGGKCYLKLLAGESPTVLPVMTAYRKQ